MSNEVLALIAFCIITLIWMGYVVEVTFPRFWAWLNRIPGHDLEGFALKEKNPIPGPQVKHQALGDRLQDRKEWGYWEDVRADIEEMTGEGV